MLNPDTNYKEEIRYLHTKLAGNGFPPRTLVRVWELCLPRTDRIKVRYPDGEVHTVLLSHLF